MTTKLSVSDELTLDHPSTRERRYEEMLITPKLAEEWLGLNHLNRNQRKASISAYTRDMEQGKWLITGESIKFDWNGDLIDGQHRLEAIIRSGMAIVSLVAFNLDPKVRSVLDVNIKRSGADALKFDGVDSYTNIIASMARASIAWDNGWYQARGSTAIDGGSTLAPTHLETIQWYNANTDVHDAVLRGKQAAKRLGGTPTSLVFAVFKTNRIDPNEAMEFWTSVINLQTDGKGDPRLALADAFDRIKRQNLALRTPMQLSLLFRAWNAWRAGKSVKRLEIFGSRDSTGRITPMKTPEPK